MLPTLTMTPTRVALQPPGPPVCASRGRDVAAAVLRCAVLPVPHALPANLTPAQAVRALLERESSGLSRTCDLRLFTILDDSVDRKEEDDDGREATLLTLRYLSAAPYTLRPVRREWDRASRGALGGLLGELRRATGSLCPLFTPEDALDDSPYGFPFAERDREGLLAVINRQRAARTLPPVDLSLGGANRVLRQDGIYTYSDLSRLGWTLGMGVQRGQALDPLLARLPAPLQARAERVRAACRELEALRRRVPAADWPDCNTLCDCFGDPDPAFLVTQDDEHGLLYELLAEQQHQQVEDTHPLHCRVWDTRRDLEACVQAALCCARALKVTRRALTDLGAEPLDGEA